MWTANFFIFILFVLNIYANCEVYSDAKENTYLKSDASHDEELSDIEKRREIARNYLSSFTKENWVDPFDMIAPLVDEYQSAKPIKPEHVESIINEPNVDTDFRPLFSDIRGEVIGPNSLSRDDSDDYFSKSDGKLLSSGRHQICVLDSIYISRWLKKLISKIESDSELEPTAINIPLDSESLIELKEMSVAKSLEIADIDEIVCNLIAKVTILRREAYDWTYITEKTIIVLCSCFALYVLYISLTTSFVYTIMCCFLFLSVFWHWMHLYQKQIAAKHYQLSMQTPSGCQKVELSIMGHVQAYIQSFFATEDCVKYYEALLVNPIWEVSLSVAVSETFAAALFQPLYSFSKALNASVKILFADLSFFSMFILVLFLFIFIIMLCGYKLKFPFFMGSLEPSNSVHSYVEEMKLVRKPRTFDKLKNKSCEILQSLKGTSPNNMSSPGSKNTYKSDNIRILSSSSCNDLPSKSCCHSLIRRYSNDNKKSSDQIVSSFKSVHENNEDFFMSENYEKRDDYMESKSNSCECYSEENLVVNKLKVEKHCECECKVKAFESDNFDSVYNDKIFDTHIEEESSFDHACVKCERDDLQRSSNHNGCAECEKIDPD